ncbi:alpha/beta hydrolase [Streptomyces decoyicus]|uniref:alpha/beta hydrolase n=1 Tax=Streptomyces decoyicus TaxID=249567 RepID=UPI0033B51E6F
MPTAIAPHGRRIPAKQLAPPESGTRHTADSVPAGEATLMHTGVLRQRRHHRIPVLRVPLAGEFAGGHSHVGLPVRVGPWFRQVSHSAPLTWCRGRRHLVSVTVLEAPSTRPCASSAHQPDAHRWRGVGGLIVTGPLDPTTSRTLRRGVPAEDTERLARIARKASLVNQKLVGTTRTDTPILAIHTPDDPLAPVSDIKRLVASSSDGELKITDGSGHCPPLKERYEAARGCP